MHMWRDVSYLKTDTSQFRLDMSSNSAPGFSFIVSTVSICSLNGKSFLREAI